MKKTLFSLLLLVSVFQVMAQESEKTFIFLNESRPIDTDIYKKNYPKVRNWWINETKDITYNFSAHTSESGRSYSMVFLKGDENLGAYVSKRTKLSEKIEKELKAEMDESKANQAQATIRSIWVQVKNMSTIVPDFKMENYDFRKVSLFTVPIDKMEAYEKLIEQSLAEDKALGFVYNYIIYKAIEGYPSNTYMMILPDKSIVDYYTNQGARNAKRKGNAKSTELSKKAAQLRTGVRMDHLNRVPIQ